MVPTKALRAYPVSFVTYKKTDIHTLRLLYIDVQHIITKVKDTIW